MTLLQLYIPDKLLAEHRRRHPHADLAAILRATLLEQNKDYDREQEARRWNPLGLVGRGRGGLVS